MFQDSAHIIWTFKPIGWNPKDCILELKKLPQFKDEKFGFAGRLDPMACGLLPIIRNDKKLLRKNVQESFKSYRFSVVFGFKTDTFDILGIPSMHKDTSSQVNHLITDIMQTDTQVYPPYSSKTVYSEKYGKMTQLWKLAKNNELPDILPTRKINIEKLEVTDQYQLTNEELFLIIQKRISTLRETADFRQREIMMEWTKLLKEENTYMVFNFVARVSTGTYIRRIADDFGGVAFDISRFEVHNLSISSTLDDYDKFSFTIIPKF